MGTLILVLVGCGSCVGGDSDETVGNQAQYVRLEIIDLKVHVQENLIFLTII